MYTRKLSRGRLGNFEGLGVSRTLGNQFGRQFGSQFGDVKSAKLKLHQAIVVAQAMTCRQPGVPTPMPAMVCNPALQDGIVLAQIRLKEAEKAEKAAEGPGFFDRIGDIIGGVVKVGTPIAIDVIKDRNRPPAATPAPSGGAAASSGPTTGTMLGIGGAVIGVVALLVLGPKLFGGK